MDVFDRVGGWCRATVLVATVGLVAAGCASRGSEVTTTTRPTVSSPYVAPITAGLLAYFPTFGMHVHESDARCLAETAVTTVGKTALAKAGSPTKVGKAVEEDGLEALGPRSERITNEQLGGCIGLAHLIEMMAAMAEADSSGDMGSSSFRISTASDQCLRKLWEDRPDLHEAFLADPSEVPLAYEGDVEIEKCLTDEENQRWFGSDLPSKANPPTWQTETAKPSAWWPGGSLVYRTMTGSDIVNYDPVHDRTEVIVGDAGAPAVSPDGATLAFDVIRPPAVPHVATSRMDGTGVAPLTTPPANAVLKDGDGDSNAAWSPDGKLIAFSRSAPGATGVYVVAPDGTGLRKVTGDVAYPAMLSWSADGTQLAVADSNIEASIKVIDVASGAVVDTIAHAEDPSYSPDGKWLAYVTDWEQDGKVQLRPTEGGKARDVPSLRSVRATAFAPSWSPDSKWLVVPISETGVAVASVSSSEAHLIRSLYDEVDDTERLVWLAD